MSSNGAMRISELAGDASVTDVVFAAGQVKCKFEDGDTGKEYSVSVPTQVLYSQGSSEEGSSEAGTVHIRLIELKTVLPVEPNSQLYVAPLDFGAQMQAAREGFTLAIGLKATEWPLLLQIRGYRVLIACPIQSEQSVSVEPLT